MASLNKVILIGNLTRDPDLKFLPSGQAVCEFGLAMNRSWKSSDGQKKEDVAFVNVVAWGKTGESIAQYLKKGSQCSVEGRLQSQSWEDPDGKKRSKLQVVSERVIFLGAKRDGGQGSDQGAPPPEPNGAGDDNIEF